MRRGIALALACCGIGAILTIGVTSAGFLQTMTAAGNLAGAVAVGQGTGAAERFDDPAHPHLVAQVTPDSRGIATLHDDRLPNPTRPTASFAVRAVLLPESAPADLRIELGLDAGAAPWTAQELRFGIDVDGVSQDPGGVPRTLQQIADSGGIDLGERSPGSSAAEVKVRVWLASAAPAEAYGQEVAVNATVVAETATGTEFDVRVVLQ